MSARLLPILILALGVCPALRAFVFLEDTPAWPNGTVRLELQLGGSPTYTDGTTPNSTAIQALQAWNPVMDRVELAYVNNSGAAKSRTNGKNNVFFSDKVYGTAFSDGVLAVTIYRNGATAPIEADIVVNNEYSWDSYRGYLRTKYDLRRVLIHEIGHVLGLDHPDEYGQWVEAIMNSQISDIDALQQDDKDGASTRYGRGPGNPLIALVVTAHPMGGTILEGHVLTMTATASGSMPITYQWIKDGAEIPGETKNYIQFMIVRASDSGKYQIRFTNEAGSVTSNEAILTVTPATLPVFQNHPPTTISVEMAGTLNLSGWASSNVPITYQWTRDGVEIPGATSSFLNIGNVSPTEAGTYRLVATTVAGSVASNGALVTVIPARLPVFTLHPTNSSAVLGQWHTFYANATSAQPMSYQWTRNGIAVPGATQSNLQLPGVTEADGGVYRLEVTSIAGTVTSEPASLVITPIPPPPAITLSNMTSYVGAHFSLSVEAPWAIQGTTYQWYKDGIAIPNATSSNFYIQGMTPAHAGEYFVVSTNASGATTSTTGILQVAPGSTAGGGWVQSRVHAGIAYFAFENPARIERFDLASETWMPALTLSQIPKAMTFISDSTMIVGFNRALASIDLGTGQVTPLATIDYNPVDLQVHNDRLYILAHDPTTSSDHKLGSISLTTPGAATWPLGIYLIGPSFAIDRARNMLFVTKQWSQGLRAYTLDGDGSIAFSVDTPHTYTGGVTTRAYVRPDGVSVLTDDGFAYSTSNLTGIGQIIAPVDAMDFADGLTLALKADSVSCLDANLRELGILTLSRVAHQIAVHGDKLFAFAKPAGGAGSTIAWESHALSRINIPTPRPGLSPVTLTYPADDIIMDRDGTILLYSRLHGNIFRWSIEEQRYLETIALQGRPNSLAYSSETNRLYTGYTDGRIRVIDLDESLTEHPFATAGQSSMSLAAAGDHLLTQSPFYSRNPIQVYNHLGQLTGTGNLGLFSRVNTWNPSRRRIYHFRDDSSSSLLHYTEVLEDGTIGITRETAYNSTVSMRAPIRISPSGEVMLLGGGNFFNPDTLVQNNSLPHEIHDAAWLETRLYSTRATLHGAEIKRWGGSNYGQDGIRTLSGQPLRLFPWGHDRLVAVTYKTGRVCFTLLDADLNIRTHFEEFPDVKSVRLANLSTRASVGTGDDIMIAGFVVTGSQSTRVLVRAIGPTLHPMGVSGELQDPVLTLLNREGSSVAQNDDWSAAGADTLKEVFSDVGAFGLPDASKDSAVIADLVPGSYTAHVSGKAGGQGIALVEAYDLADGDGTQRLVNISTRAVVGIGDHVMIPGLVINGNDPKRVLIRAVGPGLSIFGLTGLADPQFTVIDSDGRTVAANDNWGSDNIDVTVASSLAAGAFDLADESKDAALVTTLAPGSYTVVVSGVNDTTGLALVEIYEVP